MQADQPIALQVTGWRRGFASLWSKEMGQWWRTRQWLAHLLIWTVVLNGLLVVISFAALTHPEETGPLLQNQLDLLLHLGPSATAIGVLVVMQGSMIGERQSGTAAWILSKPVSRASMILAKFGANAVSYLSLAVLVPCAIAYVEIRLFGQSPALGAFLGVAGILLVHTLFYLSLTLMLGACFEGRGAVLGIGFGTLFLSSLLPGVLPFVTMIAPFGLPDIGMGLFGLAPLPDLYWVPVVASLVWSLLFLVVAIRRFEREEL